MTGFSIFSITILYKSQDVTFGLFTTISVMKVVGTLHSLSYDILSPAQYCAPVGMGIFRAHFLVYSSVGNRGKQNSGWLKVMESFSVIWCSFLLVNVQFFVWKVGEYLLLIIKIFVLFEKGTSCFISFSSQLKLLWVNCHAVCVVT